MNNRIIGVESSNEYEDDGGAEKSHRRRKSKQGSLRYVTIALAIALTFLLVHHQYNDNRTDRRDRRMSNVRNLMKNALLRKRNGSRHAQKNRRPDENFGGGAEDRKNGDTDYIHQNLDDGTVYNRWADPRHLPAIPTRDHDVDRAEEALRAGMKHGKNRRHKRSDFRVKDDNGSFPWEEEGDDEITGDHVGPKVDYTKIEVKHPKIITVPKDTYPPLEPLKDIFERWPQDEFDDPPLPHIEKLLHFDYMDKAQRKTAARFRDAEVPFKMYNVPELDEATLKWTDEYLAGNFDRRGDYKGVPTTKGHCQESVDDFFAFFRDTNWNIDTMGPPPTLDNDLTFAQWAKHARYADKVGLQSSDKHYYWQSGVPESERKQSKKFWSFVSRDLPTFSSPHETFFQFKPEFQKGMQCRFGERGVIAATHYDSGRNMIAMITGAKRYVLSPPKACGNLGIINKKDHPAYRHSMLNYGHMNLLKDPNAIKDMPSEEREWLQLAQNAPSIDTILRAGEALYIPSHWFHFIISLQKSAQCNTRSGVNKEHSGFFGSISDVKECVLSDV